MGSFSLVHWLIVILVIMLLFGRGKISELMGDMAKGINSFKKGLADGDQPHQGYAPPYAPPHLAPPAQPPYAPPAQGQQYAPPAGAYAPPRRRPTPPRRSPRRRPATSRGADAEPGRCSASIPASSC